MFTVPTVETFSHHMPAMSVQRSAEAYDGMTSEHSALIDYSYRALKWAVLDQYNAMVNAGLVVTFQSGDAYANSSEMRADVATWKIRVRQTMGQDYVDLGADHPMQAIVQTTDGRALRINDVFRAVHDVFGHYAASAGFGPDGEALAWLTHRSTMPAEALLALWCETRGQNTWTNWYGRDLPIADRPFAEQKFGVVSSELT